MILRRIRKNLKELWSVKVNLLLLDRKIASEILSIVKILMNLDNLFYGRVSFLKKWFQLSFVDQFRNVIVKIPKNFLIGFKDRGWKFQLRLGLFLIRTFIT